jgi:hypothetical protein
MTGLFLASLWLSAAVVGTTLLSDDVEPALAPSTPFGSLRFWVLSALGFGLAGLALAVMAVGPLVSVAAAGAVGALLGRVMWPVFSDSSADVTLYRLAGEEGRVLVPVDPTHGKIVVDSGASRVELPARTGDGSRLAVGQRVLVAFVEDGVACVIGY